MPVMVETAALKVEQSHDCPCHPTVIHRNSKVLPRVKLSQWCESCKLCRDQSRCYMCQQGRLVWKGKARRLLC